MAAVGVAPLPPKGSHLHRPVLRQHGDRTVLQAGWHRAGKEGHHPLRPGVGAHIPVPRRPAQQEIPHAAPHRVGVVKLPIQGLQALPHPGGDGPVHRGPAPLQPLHPGRLRGQHIGDQVGALQQVVAGALQQESAVGPVLLQPGGGVADEEAPGLLPRREPAVLPVGLLADLVTDHRPPDPGEAQPVVMTPVVVLEHGEH